MDRTATVGLECMTREGGGVTSPRWTCSAKGAAIGTRGQEVKTPNEEGHMVASQTGTEVKTKGNHKVS